MIRMIRLSLLNCLLFIIIAGCSFKTVDENAEKKYQQKSTLETVISIPENIKKEEDVILNLSFSKDKKMIKKVDNLVVQLWEKGSERQLPLTLDESSEGFYQIKTNFPQEGLYYIKINARYNDSIVMPTKQFIVGDYKEYDYEDNDVVHESHHEGHDSHH